LGKVVEISSQFASIYEDFSEKAYLCHGKLSCLTIDQNCGEFPNLNNAMLQTYQIAKLFLYEPISQSNFPINHLTCNVCFYSLQKFSLKRHQIRVNSAVYVLTPPLPTFFIVRFVAFQIFPRFLL
jgi:hypothetical protein